MENITNYTLEEFIRLYEDLEKLINLPEKEYYSRGQFKRRNEYARFLSNYAVNLINSNPKDPKIAAVIINSVYLGKSGEFYKYLDNELRNNKFLTLLAINNGLSAENYNLIGDALRNDREVMYLIAMLDYSRTKEISLKCFKEQILKDKDFFAHIFSNSSDMGYTAKRVLETCIENKIDIDIQTLNDAWIQSKKTKQTSNIGMYENPYDSGIFDYFKTYNNTEIIEIIDTFNQNSQQDVPRKPR